MQSPELAGYVRLAARIERDAVVFDAEYEVSGAWSRYLTRTLSSLRTQLAAARAAYVAARAELWFAERGRGSGSSGSSGSLHGAELRLDEARFDLDQCTAAGEAFLPMVEHELDLLRKALAERAAAIRDRRSKLRDARDALIRAGSLPTPPRPDADPAAG